MNCALISADYYHKLQLHTLHLLFDQRVKIQQARADIRRASEQDDIQRAAHIKQARHLSIIIPCCCTTPTSLGKSCLRLSDLCVAKWHRIVRKLLLFRCLGSDVNSDDTRFVARSTYMLLLARPPHPFFVVVDRPRTLWRPMRD